MVTTMVTMVAVAPCNKKVNGFHDVWQSAGHGWSLCTLVRVTDELRPLRYECDLEMADLAYVQTAQLDRSERYSACTSKFDINT